MALRDFAPDPEQPRPQEFLDSPDEPLDALADYRRRMEAARSERDRIDANDRVARGSLGCLAILFLFLLAAAFVGGQDRQALAEQNAPQELSQP